MDVLLARDSDLLWLIFEVLDVIVDGEYVFVELGEVVELWRKEDKGGFQFLYALFCTKTHSRC